MAAGTDGQKWKDTAMGRLVTMDLDNTPWPASILKCNEGITTMRSGDRLVATLKDTDALQTLRILLQRTPGITFRVHSESNGFRIEAEKE